MGPDPAERDVARPLVGLALVGAVAQPRARAPRDHSALPHGAAHFALRDGCGLPAVGPRGMRRVRSARRRASRAPARLRRAPHPSRSRPCRTRRCSSRCPRNPGSYAGSIRSPSSNSLPTRSCACWRTSVYPCASR